jgi:hypothetical protein
MTEHALTCVLSERMPAWMTRPINRALNVVTSTAGIAQKGVTVLHVDSVESYVALPACDLFVSEQFSSGLRYRVRRAALVRGMKVATELPYEFLRTLYLNLCGKQSIASCTRRAMLAAIRVAPDRPWSWGAMMLFNYGGHLLVLEQRIDSMRQLQLSKTIAKTPLGQRQLLSHPQTQYCDAHAIKAVFEGMLQALLRKRPESHEEVLDTLVLHLENSEATLRATIDEARCVAGLPPTPTPVDRNADEIKVSPIEHHFSTVEVDPS